MEEVLPADLRGGDIIRFANPSSRDVMVVSPPRRDKTNSAGNIHFWVRSFPFEGSADEPFEADPDRPFQVVYRAKLPEPPFTPVPVTPDEDQLNVTEEAFRLLEERSGDINDVFRLADGSFVIQGSPLVTGFLISSEEGNEYLLSISRMSNDE
jgi:hypothetical protein